MFESLDAIVVTNGQGKESSQNVEGSVTHPLTTCWPICDVLTHAYGT